MSTPTTKPSDQVLAWVDTETTGLDAVNDELLEVACILTYIDGAPVNGKAYSQVIGASPGYRDTMRAEADRNLPVVREMHDRNGLWEELPEGRDKEDVEEGLLHFIQAGEPEHRKALMAGSSVAHDQSFVREHLPAVSAHLHYRSVDVSGLRAVLVGNGLAEALPSEGDAAHRALPDIQRSLAEYRHLLGQLARRDDLDRAIAERDDYRAKWERACLTQARTAALADTLLGRSTEFFTGLLGPILTAARAGDDDALAEAVQAAVEATAPLDTDFTPLTP